MIDALIDEMVETCIVTRARLISRAVSGIYDDALRGYGINSPQLVLLVIITKFGPVNRATLGRFHRQERSTLTRNLKIMLERGLIVEDAADAAGRSRPMTVTVAGRRLIEVVQTAWRTSQSEAATLLGSEAAMAITAIGSGLLDFDAL